MKILKKIWAFIKVEIIYAPYRLYIRLIGGEFEMRVKDSDGEILWSTRNTKSLEDYKDMFNTM